MQEMGDERLASLRADWPDDRPGLGETLGLGAGGGVEGCVRGGALPLGAASIQAGRALLTCLPKGPWLRALALPTDTVPAVTADLAIPGLARTDVCRAVTVVPDVTCVALAFSAVTVAVA